MEPLPLLLFSPQVTWQKRAMSWGPLKSSSTKRGWCELLCSPLHWSDPFVHHLHWWITDWRFPPQVSALVTMYSHEEDIDSAIDIFKQAIGYYQSEQVGAVECFGLGIRNSGASYLFSFIFIWFAQTWISWALWVYFNCSDEILRTNESHSFFNRPTFLPL